jgi:hypothetical protein
MAGAPLPSWPVETGITVDAEQRRETHITETVQTAGVVPQDEQAALRQYAATLLNEASTETLIAAPSRNSVPADRLSPFSMAAMLLLAGCIFLVVIPPVGVTFLLCAVLPLIWGAGTAALGSS